MADILIVVQDGIGLGDSNTKSNQIHAIDDSITLDDNTLIDDNIGGILNDVITIQNDYNIGTPFLQELDDVIEILEDQPIRDLTQGVEDTILFDDDGGLIYSKDSPQIEDTIVLGSDSNNSLENIVRDVDDVIVFNDGISETLTINIISPLHLSEDNHKNFITFNANVLKDSIPVPSEDFVWYSDINGLFQEGNNFDYNNLSIGTHKITLHIKNEMLEEEISIVVKQTNQSERPENLEEL